MQGAYLELIITSGDESINGNSRISTGQNSVMINILTNDDPNGVLLFDTDSTELAVAEDFIGNDTDLTYVTFNITRDQGLFGDIQVTEFNCSVVVIGSLLMTCVFLFFLLCQQVNSCTIGC